MLTIIGLGLGGPNSITMDGVISLSLSDHIFYETYTSPIHPETLEWVKLKSQKEPTHLSRGQVEEPAELIDLAKEKNISFLIVGDALSATTHVSLLLECKKNNVEYQVIHNASVLTAVAGVLGLQHYNFGPVATLVLPEGNYKPTSPIDKTSPDGLYRAATIFSTIDIVAIGRDINTFNIQVASIIGPKWCTTRK